MASEIKWADNAIENYNAIIEYLSASRSEEIALRFIELTEYKIKQISLHPAIGILSLRNINIRSIVITKHNRLYYRVVSNEIIEIVSIFDTRQNPSKNKFE